MKATDDLAASDFIFMKMEVTAKANVALLDKIEAEGRVRTKMEDMQLTLAMLDQESRQRDWFDARVEEGHKVDSRLRYPDSATGKLSVKNARSSMPAIYLYGEIGAKYGGITAKGMQEELSKLASDAAIELHVNSEGGTFTEGLAIRNLLASRAGAVVGYVDGLAASAATIVLTGCDRVVMSPGSHYMIHFTQAEIKGAVEDLESAATLMHDANEQILKCYLPRWKGTESELRAALEKESWFTAEAAVERGLADYISDTVALAAHVGSHHKYRNVPSTLTIAARGAYRPALDRVSLCMHRAICV